MKKEWWCPDCKEVIPPEHVTYNECHDMNENGCGEHVEIREIDESILEVEIISEAADRHYEAAFFDDPLDEDIYKAGFGTGAEWILSLTAKQIEQLKSHRSND